MDFQFDRPEEAMAAISWLICSADGVGSLEERNFLHGKMRDTREFAEMDPAQLSTLLAATRTKLFSKLENDGDCLSRLATDQVIQAASMVLNDEQRVGAYKMALNMAHSDGLVKAESEILNKLRSRFSITFEQLDT